MYSIKRLSNSLSRTFVTSRLVSTKKPDKHNNEFALMIIKDEKFFHKPQCMPNLKHLEEVYTDAQYRKGKKSIFDCENEPWCKDNKK